MLIRHRFDSRRTVAIAVFVTIAAVLSLLPGRAKANGMQYQYLISQVQPTMSATTLTVKATYVGPGPLTLTVGTTSNVDATKVSEVKATKGSGSQWTATASGLTPNTAYRFRLRAPDAIDYNSSDVWTLKRDVTVDFGMVYLVNDGDAWPKGCGEIIMTFSVNGQKRNTSQECLDSGTWYQPGPDYSVHFAVKGDKATILPVEIWVMDMDTGGAAGGNCDDAYNAQDASCGDLAHKIGSVSLTAGTTMFSWHMVDQNSTEAWAWFTVKVTDHS